MSKVRFAIDYVDAKVAGQAKLSVSRFEEGMIGFGLMKPVLFQQLLENETPQTDFNAMTDMWSDGEVKAFLTAALECAWRLGLRPTGQRQADGPAYAHAEVSPVVKARVEELRARALRAQGIEEALAV
jgi:hypothetical protein